MRGFTGGGGGVSGFEFVFYACLVLSVAALVERTEERRQARGRGAGA